MGDTKLQSSRLYLGNLFALSIIMKLHNHGLLYISNIHIRMCQTLEV